MEPARLHLAVNDALHDVNYSAPSTTKFLRLDTAIALQLGMSVGDVVAATVSKAGNLKVRALQSSRSAAAALNVAVLPSEVELEGTKRAAIDAVEAGQARAIGTVVRTGDGWTFGWAVVSDAEDLDEVYAGLTAFGVEVTRVSSRVGAASTPAPPESRPDLATSRAVAPLSLDARIRRMLRLAVSSRSAVMLVGPPGTGKSQLLGEVVDEVGRNPEHYGMTLAHEATMVTPDESWTTRDLVGGETVDDQGRLRFSPGHVLTAIAADRWLVLDEANRADLDKIFGALLSWLSGQTVTVGRVSSHPDAGPVRLGWNDEVTSRVVGGEQLIEAEPSGEPVDYLAGEEWRLLGTYNAIDASRVFRFGLALGRRFATVPIPAPDAAGFDKALSSRLSGIPEEHRDRVRLAVLGLYTTHLTVDSAVLGPAMFLEMPAYIGSGLRISAPLEELIGEAYLSSVGLWLSRLEDDRLDALGMSLAKDSLLGAQQWQWVRGQLTSLQ